MNKPPPIQTPPRWGSRYLLVLFLLLNTHLRRTDAQCPFAGSGDFITFSSLDSVDDGDEVWSGTIPPESGEVDSVSLLEEFQSILEIDSDIGTETTIRLLANQPGFGNYLDYTGSDTFDGTGLEVNFVNGSVATCRLVIKFTDGNNQPPQFNVSSNPIIFSIKERSWDPAVALNWDGKDVIRVTDFDHIIDNAQIVITSNSPHVSGIAELSPDSELFPNSFVYDVKLFVNDTICVVDGSYIITATDGQHSTDLTVEIVAVRENLYAPAFSNLKYNLKLANMPEEGDLVGVGMIEVEDEDGDDLILDVDVDYLVFNGKELFFIGDVDQQQQLKGQTVDVTITATEENTAEEQPTSVTLTIEFPRMDELTFSQTYYFDDGREEWEEIGAGDVILENEIQFSAEAWEDDDIKLRLIPDARTPDFVGAGPDERTLTFTRALEEIDMLRLGSNRVMVLNVQAYLERDGEEVTATTTVVVAFATGSYEIVATEETTTEDATSEEPCECTCPECETTTEYTETTPDSTTTPTDSTATPPECPSTPDPPDCPTEPPCDCTTTETPWWTTGTPPDCPPPIECPTTTPDPTTPTECECPSTTPESTTPTECPPPIECPSTTLEPTSTPCDCSESSTETPTFPPITECPTTEPCDCPTEAPCDSTTTEAPWWTETPPDCPPPIECPSTTPEPPSTPCDCLECTTETPTFPPITECPTTAPCDCPISTEIPSSTRPECPPCPTTTPRPQPTTCPTPDPCPECPPTQPPCPPTTSNPNCPTPEPCPTTTPPNCPPPPCDCDNCENDPSCPPCDDDCSTGGLIAAIVVTSVLFIVALSVAGYLFWVLRRAAINPFSRASPSAPNDPEVLRSRNFSFGEEPGLANKGFDSAEPGYTNPTFTPEESTHPRSSISETFSPIAASSSPTPQPQPGTSSVMPIPITSSSDPTEGSSTSPAPAPKSIIKRPSEVESDYGEDPQTGAAAATTAGAAEGAGDREQ